MATDRIRFCDTPLSTVGLPDEDFLRLLQWRKSVDSQMSAAAAAGDREAFAQSLRRAASSGKRSRGGTEPLLQPLWSRHAFGEAADPGDGAAFLKELQRLVGRGKSGIKSKTKVRISRFVARELASSQDAPASALSLLQWLTVLTTLGAELFDGVLFALWRRTLEISLAMELGTNGASPIGEFSHPGEAAHDVDRGHGIDDRRLLVAGELPWRTGLCFSDLRGAGKLRKAGRRCLRDGLEALTDGDGTPHAGALHRLPLTLAVLTRSAAAGQAAGELLWGTGEAERFESLITRAAGLCHGDGRIALSNGASFAPASLLRTASQVAGLSKREPSARRLLSLPDDSPLSGQRNRKRPSDVGRHKNRLRFDAKTPPSAQSDWAELACLRNNWSVGADRCVIAYHQAQPQICLTAFEQTLIDGDWQSDLCIDGEPVALEGEWSCVCWFSDQDADYLELQQDAGGAVLTRQVMLSRTDHWLFLADSAVAGQAETVELATRLPLDKQVDCRASKWSRELHLARKKLKATAYPLALDQQRVMHAYGSLEEQAGELQLRQRATGAVIYAPLLIDWSPDRRRASKRHQFEWRRLTVAEDGVILGADAAAGFRLRVGEHQWLFYRSLVAGETARTVLGHHTRHETVIAEFTADGNVEPLVMVE